MVAQITDTMMTCIKLVWNNLDRRSRLCLYTDKLPQISRYKRLNKYENLKNIGEMFVLA